jgi:hypothetical protein
MALLVSCVAISTTLIHNFTQKAGIGEKRKYIPVSTFLNCLFDIELRTELSRWCEAQAAGRSGGQLLATSGERKD